MTVLVRLGSCRWRRGDGSRSPGPGGWSGRLGLDERAGALGVELGRRHRGLVLTACRRVSRFFLTARVRALGSPSWAAGRCRLARPGSPGCPASAAVIAWSAGSCWCTAPHPLMRQSRGVPLACSGICWWAPEGSLPDRRGDPWLTAGLRPVRFASRCCAALCGRDADDYSVAATVVIQSDCRQVSPNRGRRRG